MKTTPTFGMIFRFSNEIKRADAAALLRTLRRHSRPMRVAPGSYYFNSLLLSTR